MERDNKAISPTHPVVRQEQVDAQNKTAFSNGKNGVNITCTDEQLSFHNNLTYPNLKKERGINKNHL